MVTAIVIGVAVITSVALLVFKGININFNKTFTINDNRKILTREESDHLEKALNTDEDDNENREKEKVFKAPLDSVLASMQEIFGPEDPNGGSRE